MWILLDLSLISALLQRHRLDIAVDDLNEQAKLFIGEVQLRALI